MGGACLPACLPTTTVAIPMIIGYSVMILSHGAIYIYIRRELQFDQTYTVDGAVTHWACIYDEPSERCALTGLLTMLD